MSQIVENVLVASIIASALGYVARAFWKTWAKPGCGSGCGKCQTSQTPSEQDHPERISLPQV
jgi:FeoB-associated Cys-rich membrane protein